MEDWREGQRTLYVLHRTGLKKKQGTQAVATSHNITINNKLNLHYLQNLFQLKRKKKSNLVQNVFLYSQILRRAE